MTRGEIVLISDKTGDYTGKPRPALVVRSDLFAALEGVTICPLTTTLLNDAPTRIAVSPGPNLQLGAASQIQVDKISTVRSERIGPSLGRISRAEMAQVGAAIAMYLDVGSATGTRANE